jgi:hypothetical protein
MCFLLCSPHALGCLLGCSRSLLTAVQTSAAPGLFVEGGPDGPLSHGMKPARAQAHHHRQSQARHWQPLARSGLCGAAQPAGESVCRGEGWQPPRGDRKLQAVAVGKAAGARFSPGAGVAAAVGQGGGGGAGVVVLVPSVAVPCGGGAGSGALVG